MLQYFIKKGCSVENTPDSVSKLYIEHSRTSEYRKSPFIIQAACQGNLKIFETLIKHGCKIFDHGFIGFSKKRKNQIMSNVVGAAAFNNSTKILQHVLQKKSLAQINFLASEKVDINATKGFNQEYTGYTPLMLAVAGGGQNAESVRILIAHKA
jgi:Ankyrin repeat